MGRQPPSDDRLVGFYSREYRESARLERPSNRLEFARTQQLLRDRLPGPPARILDVGGGTGVHARWLAADGYDVTLVDVVPDHVRAAHELSATLPRPFAARVGDARSLDAEEPSVDACLLLGPLYHLPRPADRAAGGSGPGDPPQRARLRSSHLSIRVCAVRAARRSRSGARTRGSGRPHDGDGPRRPRGHPAGCVFAPPQRPGGRVARCGPRRRRGPGRRGTGWPLFTPDLPAERVERLLEAAIRAARLYDGHAEMTAASAHLLAVGRRACREVSKSDSAA